MTEKSIITKSIITSLNPKELVTLQTTFNNRIIVIKFGAEWCGPCKKIKPMWNEWVQTTTKTSTIIGDIDVDESLDLYMALKAKKMVKNIPVIFAYYGDIERDHWYIPDDSVIGGDLNQVNAFFERCTKKAMTLSK